MEEFVVRRPSAPLRPYVSAMVGYLQTGAAPGTHRGLPSPALTLVLTIDGPVRILEHVDGGRTASTHDALVGGLHTRPALLAHPGHQHGIQLAVTPLGARSLLAAPAGALASWDGDLDDVVGPRGGELLDRVRAAASWPARFAAVETVLGRWLREDAAVEPEVARAVSLLTGPGPVRVDAVARDVGWSPRLLQKRFRTQVGLTPKELQRVARFQHARELLLRPLPSGGRRGLADVATEAGYVDQPHLSREFRALAGTSPARWLAEEGAFVHDGEHLAMAGSTA